MRKNLIAVAAMLAATMLPRSATAQDQDPTGFVPLLNQARAARGLAPVAYDPAAVATAAANNSAQLAYGLGHHVTNGFGQVAAVGMPDVHAAFSAWCGSPGHAAILFAPDLAAVAYHQAGSCCTAATRQGAVAAVPFAGTVMTAAAPVPMPTWAYPAWVYYPAPTTWRPAYRGRRRW